MSNKVRVLHAMKIICFCLGCLLFVGVLTPVFVDKTARHEIGGYTSLPRDSVDVLFLGPSTSVTSCSPMVLWREYGISSYNIAMGGQSIPLNYYNLKSALELQSPKVVVLDISYAFQQDVLAGQPARLHQWLAFSHPSLVKLETILFLTQPNEWLDYMFPLQYYHDRWKVLEEQDITGQTNISGYGSGGGLDAVGLSDGIIILPEDDKAGIFASDINLEYLDKIITLCKEEDIKLLLFKPPARAYGAVSHGDGFELQRQWNAFADYAQEQGVEYLNCMHYLDEIGITFSSDFTDWTHGNLRGVQKVTRFIGNYLSQHYELPDCRGETAYKQWNNDCDAYYQRIENAGMTLDEKSPVHVVYSENELFPAHADGEKYNILCNSLENGRIYTVLVGEFEQDGMGEETIQVMLWDDEKKYCVNQTELMPGTQWEWSFTVPDDENSYCLVVLKSREGQASMHYVQVIEESSLDSEVKEE